ncbi:hypothetical protein Ancab_004173 [Ancistrocladus abbreviatus]
MGRFSSLFIIALLLAPLFCAPTNGRKALKEGRETSCKEGGFSILNALPKGTIPPSTPSPGTDHTKEFIYRKLFVLHQSSNNGRFLQSVPSPGVGHRPDQGSSSNP